MFTKINARPKVVQAWIKSCKIQVARTLKKTSKNHEQAANFITE